MSLAGVSYSPPVGTVLFSKSVRLSLECRKTFSGLFMDTLASRLIWLERVAENSIVWHLGRCSRMDLRVA